jgi:hypothetical protein
LKRQIEHPSFSLRALSDSDISKVTAQGTRLNIPTVQNILTSTLDTRNKSIEC